MGVAIWFLIIWRLQFIEPQILLHTSIRTRALQVSKLMLLCLNVGDYDCSVLMGWSTQLSICRKQWQIPPRSRFCPSLVHCSKKDAALFRSSGFDMISR